MLGLGLGLWGEGVRDGSGGLTPYVGRGATLGADTYFSSVSLAVPGGNQGAMSFWFKNNSPTWNDPSYARIFQFLVGSSSVWSMYTTSAGRVTMRMNQEGTGSDTVNTPAGSFQETAWNHVLWAWNYSSSKFQLYINDNGIDVSGYSLGDTGFSLNGAEINKLTLGNLVGDFGHFWASPTQTLDFSVQANREKFALNGKPVDQGVNGELPTGTAPEWYYDGDGPDWSNQGTADGGTLKGNITASATAPSY
jgi:hypothetical protein